MPTSKLSRNEVLRHIKRLIQQLNEKNVEAIRLETIKGDLWIPPELEQYLTKQQVQEIRRIQRMIQSMKTKILNMRDSLAERYNKILKKEYDITRTGLPV